MQKSLIVLSLITLLTACSSLSPKQLTGTYQGTLPCADCSKIEAELILKPNNRYEYNTVYFKQNQQRYFSDKGIFTVDNNNNKLIHLDKNAGNLSLLLEENAIEFCYPDGTKVKGSLNHKLNKINP